MDHVFFSDSNISDDDVAKLHDGSPQLKRGTIGQVSIVDKGKLTKKVQSLIDETRRSFDGIFNISIGFWLNSDRILEFVLGISTGAVSYSLYVTDILHEKILRVQRDDFLQPSTVDDEDNFEPSVPRDLIQITASPSEVDKWIEVFIAGRRNQIDRQNDKDFLVDPEERLGCARTDTKIVKKKHVSHVQVKKNQNVWGPAMGTLLDGRIMNVHGQVSEFKLPKLFRKDEEQSLGDPTQSTSTGDKKVFSSNEIEAKINNYRVHSSAPI